MCGREITCTSIVRPRISSAEIWLPFHWVLMYLDRRRSQHTNDRRRRCHEWRYADHVIFRYVLRLTPAQQSYRLTTLTMRSLLSTMWALSLPVIFSVPIPSLGPSQTPSRPCTCWGQAFCKFIYLGRLVWRVSNNRSAGRIWYMSFRVVARYGHWLSESPSDPHVRQIFRTSTAIRSTFLGVPKVWGGGIRPPGQCLLLSEPRYYRLKRPVERLSQARRRPPISRPFTLILRIRLLQFRGHGHQTP